MKKIDFVNQSSSKIRVLAPGCQLLSSSVLHACSSAVTASLIILDTSVANSFSTGFLSTRNAQPQQGKLHKHRKNQQAAQAVNMLESNVMG